MLDNYLMDYVPGKPFVIERFQLNQDSVDLLKSLTPKFGYDAFGEAVYYRTYSRCFNGQQEGWADTVLRVTNGIFSIRKDWYEKNRIAWDERFWQNFATGLSVAMFEMKWLPPGRGLWAMGTDFVYERGSMSLYNCFSGDTEFYGNQKLCRLSDYAGQVVSVLSSDSTIRKARVQSFGVQKLQTITFKPSSTENGGSLGKSNLRIQVRATKNHRWLLPDGSETTDLKVGNKIKVNKDIPFSLDVQGQEYINGLSHGLIFGDGTQQTDWETRYTIRLCKDTIGLLKHNLERCNWYRTTCQPPSYKGDYAITLVTNNKLKQVPETASLNYLRGFFDGWMKADATENGKGQYCLDSSNEEAIEWAIKMARLIGYVPTGISYDDRETNFGPRSSRLNRLKLRKDSCLFQVTSIEDKGHEEEVFCVVEPETRSFTLAGGLTTGNCAYTDIGENMADDLMWAMDALMNGVGVGFGPKRDDTLELYTPRGSYDFIIPDSREGWVYALGLRLTSYLKPWQASPRFIYDKIRSKNKPIKGFGGLSSGPEPLRELLDCKIIECMEAYKSNRKYDSVRLKVDLANHIGCCVVAGNVRRSAELMCAPISDETFLELKNYEKNPDRRGHGWMSNNSVILQSDEDFESLGEIAMRVVRRGEPGYINARNMQYGRVGKKEDWARFGIRPDKAIGFNPCGEIGLEHRETCNVAETAPTVCENDGEWYQACEYACFYCSTVSLLPTHQQSTNAVVNRNRRIGVSIIDVSGWKLQEGVHRCTKYMREGYRAVRDANKKWNGEAGVPESIRVTTIKPGGTTPKLPGRTPGIGFPNFEYTIRRMRCQAGSPYDETVTAAGYPRELDMFSQNTAVFEFPIKQGPAKPISEVTLWEQAMTLVWVQREWSDNAVSNTLYFRPKWAKLGDFEIKKMSEWSHYTDVSFDSVGLSTGLMIDQRSEYENDKYRLLFNYKDNFVEVFEYDPNHEENDVEQVLSFIAPLTKSVALCPYSTKGAYPQMPEEGITEQEYLERLSAVLPIDWTKFGGSDGVDERYCEGPQCQVSPPKVSNVP